MRSPKSIVPGGEGPRSNLNISPLAFMLIVILVAVGTVVWLAGLGDDEVERVPFKSIEPVEAVEIETEAVAWDPETDTWGNVDDLTPEGRRSIPVAALKKAVEKVGRRSWDAFRLVPAKIDDGWVGFQRLDVPRLFAASQVLRGQAFEVLGRLDSLEEVDVFDAYDRLKLASGETRSWQGVITPDADVHGSSAPVRFLMVDDMEEPQIVVGETVKLQGVFFKLQEVARDGEAETGIWMLGKRLFRNYRIPEADQIDLGVLDSVVDVRDGQSARHAFEDQQIFQLVADIARRPDRDRGEGKDMTGKKIRELLAEPRAYRGELLHFQGRILRVEEIPMSAFFPENADGDHVVDRVWITYLTTDGVIPLTMVWLKKPDLDLQLSDQVMVQGVFYRIWGYKTSAHGWVRAPLIFGLGPIEKIDIHASTGMSRSLAIGLVCFALLVTVIVVVALRADRKNSDLFRKRRASRKQVQRGPLDLNDVARRAARTEAVEEESGV
ncbi:MAG: hypothetical protein R3F20_04750 [Planctomycetota bacterium]